MMYLFKGLDVNTNEIVKGHFSKPCYGKDEDTCLKLIDVENGIEYKVNIDTVTSFTGYYDKGCRQIFYQDVCVDDELDYVCRVGFDEEFHKFGIYVNSKCIGPLTEKVAKTLRVVNSIYAYLGQGDKK